MTTMARVSLFAGWYNASIFTSASRTGRGSGASFPPGYGLATHPVIIASLIVTGTRPSASRIPSRAEGNSSAGGTVRARARTAFVSPAARKSRNNCNGSA
jgi:hypothetical protein